MNLDPLDGPESADLLRKLLDKSGITANLVEQWASSPERSWYLSRRSKLRWYVLAAIVFIVVGLTNVAATLTPDSWWTTRRTWAAISCVLGIVGLAWCTVPYWAARRAFSARKRVSARYRVDEALRELREAMESTKGGTESRSRVQLARMFELNRRQLDEYQQLTKSQQRTAFALTWGAAIAAFLILAAGSIVALQRDAPDDKYIATGLTALGTLLSAFLGKTFFDGHKEAMNQLNHYYHEPSLTGRLLTAERILDRLPDNAQKGEAATKILTHILAWEPPPMPGGKEKKKKKTTEENQTPDDPSDPK